MFDGLVVHAETLEQLERIAKNPPHALLITGIEHIGKRLIARALAEQLIGAKNGSLDNEPMYRELTVEKTSITAESVRTLLQFLSLKTLGERQIQRVVLIPDAELMTKVAQNALLKILEEPPADAVIVLTTSRLSQLLPTIISRCQRIIVKKPDIIQTEELLVNEGKTADIAEALARSDGAVGLALDYIRSEETAEYTSIAEVKSFLGLSMFDQLLAVGIIAKDRLIARQFTETLLLITEKAMLHSASKQWRQIVSACLIAIDSLEKNANVKLVLTELVLSLR